MQGHGPNRCGKAEYDFRPALHILVGPSPEGKSSPVASAGTAGHG